MSKRTRRSGARPSRALQSTFNPGEPDSGPNGHRQERLERILRDEVQALLRDEASDPYLEGIRVVSVELSVDGSCARLAYVVQASLGEERRVEVATKAALSRATAFLRARLAALLDLKRLPKLAFAFVGVQQEGGDPWHG